MKILKILPACCLLASLSYGCTSNGKTSHKNMEVTATKEENKFTGVYNMKDAEGKMLVQSLKITFTDGHYYVQAEGAERYKCTLSENGDMLLAESQESSNINDDGSVEINLEGEVKIYFKGTKLIYEMTIPDMGTEYFELIKK